MIARESERPPGPPPPWDGEPLDVRDAFDRLDGYGRTYGQVALRLLLHAAIPQTLRPDLVNLLRINFLPEAGRDASIDADLLFSPLCEHSGAGYYRMDAEVRRHAIALLDAVYSPVPEPRSRRVARFLLAYADSCERRSPAGPDPLLREFLDIQRWVAIAFLDPARAAARFAEALQREVEVGATAVHLRLSGLAAALAIPLTGHAELIVYARGLDALVSGDVEYGRTIMQRLGDRDLNIGGIRLTAPTRVLSAFVGKEKGALNGIAVCAIYARHDRESASRLLAVLEEEGAEVTWRGTEPAEPSSTRDLQEAVHRADCVLLLWTFAAKKSEFLNREVFFALREKKLVPVRLDDAAIAPELRAIPHADLRSWRGDPNDRRLRQLIAAVAATAENMAAAVAERRAADATASAKLRTPLPDLAVFRDVDAPWCPEMVALPAGSFLMGSPEKEEERYGDEGPQHKVTIGARFAIGRYPVTVGEYRKFVEVTHHRHEGGMRVWTGSEWKHDASKSWQDPGFAQADRNPVVGVSWRDAVAYCEWLAKETGEAYRLPSEAEWEYAARAGTTTRYAWGDAITPKNANYSESKLGKTTEVGAYPPNPWGLYDMHGNVWEWVEDVWHDGYKDAPADGSPWTDGEGTFSSRIRVLRGGSWDVDPGFLRSAYRGRVQPESRGNLLGFRVARTLS